MNDIARKRGWTQKKWNDYKAWMHSKYGWADFMVRDNENTMNDYERELAREERRQTLPATIGAPTQEQAARIGFPPATPPPETTTSATPTAQTTVSPLPKGVTLTGERKIIGEDEYEKGSDGRWYKIKLAPSVGGVAPTDLIMEAPGLYYSRSAREWWFITEAGLYQTTSEFAEGYLADYQAGRTLKPPEPSIAQQQWDISKNRREWATGVSIEQDITTGKLYRSGSMVEVSPDIATAELQKAQTQRDWTGEQLGLEREKFAWAKEQVARAQDPELQRATNELRWERDRIQLLSGLPSDDWISRYTLQNQPNPYKLSEENVHTSRMNQVATNLDQRTGEVQNLQNQLASAVTSGNAETAAKIEAELKNTTASRDYLYELYNTMQKETMNWTPQPAPQPYPNAPEWLSQYVVDQIAGRMITPQNVPTPSGQQLTQMSPSRASQLGYYADWTRKMGAGRNWQDILGEAKLMQPYTPRGAGSFRTSPARQWV